ncbi:hypothetical protein [Psychroflexus planctonicus]|uniref:Uncharacterized protein n=1 Tax=Psychroflexus planctonicus TaxID=1526575 RepID=A0ABQ1SFV3_9FLAO|nr:hypothetical protein [Psychroflexus planctonicus]GGE31644.1 hypothetical protein GCM10010832_09970 [Psychroflexus planctonicus]
MNKTDFWKNFSLGTELEISGNFIYNSLKIIDTINNYDYPEEVFELLYNTSVGFERLMKIAIILLEHDGNNYKEVVNKKFESHNLITLLDRIKKNSLYIGVSERAFLHLLSNFYKHIRYGRYSLNEENNYQKDKDAFKHFILKYLKTQDDNFRNTVEIKSFLLNIISKIATELYRVIKENAKRQNIDTYRLKPNGKAYQIFILNDFSFENQNRLKIELLIFLLNTKDLDIVKILKGIEPLHFDISNSKGLMKSILFEHNLNEYSDFLEHHYDELSNIEERLNILDFIWKV